MSAVELVDAQGARLNLVKSYYDDFGRKTGETSDTDSWTQVLTLGGRVASSAPAGYEQSFDPMTGAVTRRGWLSTQQSCIFDWNPSNSRLNSAELRDAQGARLNLIYFFYDDFGRKDGERSETGSDSTSWVQTWTVGGKVASSAPDQAYCYYDACGRLVKKIYQIEDIPRKLEIDIQYSAGTMSRISLNDKQAGLVAQIDFTYVDGRETSRIHLVATIHRIVTGRQYQRRGGSVRAFKQTVFEFNALPFCPDEGRCYFD